MDNSKDNVLENEIQAETPSDTIVQDDDVRELKDFFTGYAVNTIEIGQALLKKKFGCDFVPVAIGNRMGHQTADIYYHPDYNSDIVFKAVVDPEKEEITENFIRRAVSYKASDYVVDELLNNSINSEARMTFYADDVSGETDHDIDPVEFIKKYNVDEIAADIIIDSFCFSRITAQVLSSLIKGMYDRFGVDVYCDFYLIGNGFDECCKRLLEDVDLSEDSIKKYELKRHLYFGCVGGDLTVSDEQLASMLKGEA